MPRQNYSSNPKSYAQLLSFGVRPSQIREAINSGLNPAQLPPEYFGLNSGWTPQSVGPGAAPSNEIGGIDFPPADMNDPYGGTSQWTPPTQNVGGNDIAGFGLGNLGIYEGLPSSAGIGGGPTVEVPTTGGIPVPEGFGQLVSPTSFFDPSWDFTGTPTQSWYEPGPLAGTGQIPIPEGFGDLVQPQGFSPIGDPTVEIMTDPWAGAEASGSFGSGVDPFEGATAGGSFGTGTSLSDFYAANNQYGEGMWYYDANGDIVPVSMQGVTAAQGTPGGRGPMSPYDPSYPYGASSQRTGFTGGFGVGAGPGFGVTPAGFSTGYTPFGGAGSGGSMPGTSGGRGGVGPQFSPGSLGVDTSLPGGGSGFGGGGLWSTDYMHGGVDPTQQGTGPGPIESLVASRQRVSEAGRETKRGMSTDDYAALNTQPQLYPAEWGLMRGQWHITGTTSDPALAVANPHPSSAATNAFGFPKGGRGLNAWGFARTPVKSVVTKSGTTTKV